MAKNNAEPLYIRQDIGTGNPLVLLHGIFADGTQWEKITELLKSEFRVIVLDVLGHGRSPRPKNASYGPEEQVAAMRAALVKCGATKNVTLVGYSMGGAVALSYAAVHKTDIEQLYLLSTPFYLQPEQMVAANFAASALVTKTSTKLFETVEALLQNGGVLQKAVDYGDKSKKFHQLIGAHDNKLDADVIRHSIRNLIHEFDFCGTLQKVTAPVTYYAGKKDPFIVQGQLRALKKYSPYIHIQRLEIIKIDHMLVQNLPHEIAKLVTVNKNNTLHVASDTGKGEPLVLLHGIESSSSYWDAIAPVLAKKRRVICIDLLGFGDSPKPLNIAYSLEDHANWLGRTLDAMGVQRCEIAAHSLGSLVALKFAALHPKLVSKLTLFSPVLIAKDELSNNILLQNLKYFYQFSDTSYLYSHAASAVGEARLARFIPTIRSIENSVKNQHSEKFVTAIAEIPVHILYGNNDRLIDEVYLQAFTDSLQSASLLPLENEGHNFPLFNPNVVLKALAGQGVTTTLKPKKTPRNFTKQLVRLTAPVLFIKSALYIVAGALLFTDYAPALLTISLALYVMKKGYDFIQGAFSLKNEGLSYIGYVLLGIFAIVVGFGLYRHPEAATKISVYALILFVIGTGAIRLIAAKYWAKTKRTKRALYASGLPMFLLGLVALTGSLLSVDIIIYVVAVWLIFRGAQYGIYTLGAASLAYIRGFNKE